MVITTINAETAESAETFFSLGAQPLRLWGPELNRSEEKSFCVFRVFCVDRRGLKCFC